MNENGASSKLADLGPIEESLQDLLRYVLGKIELGCRCSLIRATQVLVSEISRLQERDESSPNGASSMRLSGLEHPTTQLYAIVLDSIRTAAGRLDDAVRRFGQSNSSDKHLPLLQKLEP